MRLNVPFFALLAIACLSCSSVRVLEKDPEVGFKLADYKTFDFFEVEASGDTTGSFSRNVNLLKEAIVRHLQSEGLKKSTSDHDLLINLGIVVEEKIQTRETDFRDAPRYMGQRRYTWKSENVEVG